MTAAVIVPRLAKMPTYNQSVSLDEAHSFISGNSYSQPPPASGATSAFSLLASDGSLDLMHGAPWSGPGNSQHFFQDFIDAEAQPPADSEDYAFTSGQTTPKGSKEQPQQPIAAHWNTSRESVSIPRGQAMTRIDSSSSGCSSISQTSQASSMGSVTAATAGLLNVSSDVNNSMGGMMMPSQPHGLPSVPAWPQYEFNPSLQGDYTLTVGDLESLHVAPNHMGFEQNQPAESSPSSWGDFSSSLSRTSSPATVDDAWMAAALKAHSPTGFVDEPSDSENKLSTSANGVSIPMPALSQSAPFNAAMQKRHKDAETPRDDFRYKNAVRQSDGLFHCPWEGKDGCNHKPEKLKCNYDKFVDSHLKPYRCKVKSCEGAQFSSTACRLRHEREAHGLHGHGTKPFLCPYEDCDRAQSGNGFPRQWNLRDHMKRVHNDTSGGFSDSAEGVPIEPPAQPQPASSGRKRKTDASQSAGTERRTAQRATSAVNPKVDPIKPLLQQWQEHHRMMQSLVVGLNSPGDVRNLENLREMQKLSAEMTKLSVQISAERTSRSQSSTRRKSQTATG